MHNFWLLLRYQGIALRGTDDLSLPRQIVEAGLTILDMDRLQAAPLRRDPFDFVVVEDFVSRNELASVIADFPVIRAPGSFPAVALKYGPAFRCLLEALTGPALRDAIERKFAIDLAGRPTMVTIRGKSDGKDGRIHTDSPSKIVTLLLYLNPKWEPAEGRLRLLRGPEDIADFVCEVAPIAGTMLAFRRSDRSFHGHCPHVGERRVLQLNWMTEPAVVGRELSRHYWAARLKALNPFAEWWSWRNSRAQLPCCAGEMRVARADRERR